MASAGRQTKGSVFRQLALYVPKELYEKVRQMAEQDRRSISSIVVILLEEIIKLKEERQRGESQHAGNPIKVRKKGSL